MTNQRRIGACDIVLCCSDAVGSGVASGIDVHFDSNWHAVQWPQGIATRQGTVCLVSGSKRLNRHHFGQRIDTRVDIIDAREHAGRGI